MKIHQKICISCPAGCHLEIKENGDIIVSDSTVDTIDTLPDKSLWDTLADLMRADGLTASVGHNAILISW